MGTWRLLFHFIFGPLLIPNYLPLWQNLSSHGISTKDMILLGESQYIVAITSISAYSRPETVANLNIQSLVGVFLLKNTK